MKKTLFFLFATHLFFVTKSQNLISDTLLVSYSAADLTAQGLPGIQYGVDVYKLIYNTINPDSNSTIASGALLIPTGSICDWPFLSYQHGTVLHREEVASRLYGEIVIGYIASGSYGFITSMPDYLGLGDSPGMHPYVHSNTEASASIDMLRASKEFCNNNNILYNEQLFLAGYSQGGHATMALHKSIEENHAQEFSVTASAPCAGPYDVSGAQSDVFIEASPYPAPYYLPYVILAYYEIYSSLQQYSLSEIFASPYDTLLPPLFDGYHESWEVDAVMPSIPVEIIETSFFNNFLADSTHPFWEALRDNDNYDWAPEAPVRMYYCGGDQHVMPANSTIAEAQMNLNGATDVEAIEIDPYLDHGDCALGALFGAIEWAYDKIDSCTTTLLIEKKKETFVYPNPNKGLFSFEHNYSNPLTLITYNSLGEKIEEKIFSAKKTQVDYSAFPKGIYYLIIKEGEETLSSERIILLQ